MHGFRIAHIAVAAIFAAFAACSDDTTGPATAFTASLSGTGPTGSGSGTATFAIEGQTITYTLNFQEFPASPVQAHIHTGAATATGPIALNLCGAGAAPACPAGTIAEQDSPFGAAGTYHGSVSGTADATYLAAGQSMNGVITAMRNYGAYINFHLSAPPGGEVRGNIARSN